MDTRTASRGQRALRRRHVEAAAFLHTIIDTADRLREAQAFDGSPALRFDARWTMLRAIERCGGCPSFSDLARMLRITRQSARALALAAEKAGAVELFTDPHDRRAIQVGLTPSGRRTLEAHQLPDSGWLFTLLNGLDPKLMRSTDHVLSVIARRLARDAASSRRRRTTTHAAR